MLFFVLFPLLCNVTIVSILRSQGILDLLANKSIAEPTNAWTSVDHTCYTLTTAGAEGFINILPIYVDHILFPALADASFYTEVHHISNSREDAGVVYSEMQG
jgi:Zn-dependent M16 (insulinase) family peptidase